MKTTGLCHSRCYILLYDVYSPLLVPVGVVGGPSPLLLPGGGVADPHDLHPCVPAPQGAAINGHKIASKMALPSTRAARHADGYSVTAAPCTSGAMAGIPSQLHHALPEQWRGFRHSYCTPWTFGAMAGIQSQLHHALPEQWRGFRHSCTMHFRSNGGDSVRAAPCTSEMVGISSQLHHFCRKSSTFHITTMKHLRWKLSLQWQGRVSATMTGVFPVHLCCFRQNERRVSA